MNSGIVTLSRLPFESAEDVRLRRDVPHNPGAIVTRIRSGAGRVVAVMNVHLCPSLPNTQVCACAAVRGKPRVKRGVGALVVVLVDEHVELDGVPRASAGSHLWEQAAARTC